jgi:hypothetical protein
MLQLNPFYSSSPISSTFLYVSQYSYSCSLQMITIKLQHIYHSVWGVRQAWPARMLSQILSSDGTSHLLRHLAGILVRISKKHVRSFRNILMSANRFNCIIYTECNNCLKSVPSQHIRLSVITNIFIAKKLKLSHYTSRRRLREEEVSLLLTLDLGTR